MVSSDTRPECRSLPPRPALPRAPPSVFWRNKKRITSVHLGSPDRAFVVWILFGRVCVVDLFDLCTAHASYKHTCANTHVWALANGGMDLSRQCRAVDRARGADAQWGQATETAGCAAGALRASAARREQQRETECASTTERRRENRWGD